MLTATRRADDVKVLARDADKSHAPFQCPRCVREMIVRKGNIKVHHFAHKPPTTCALAALESEEHLKAKLAIADALDAEANVQGVEIERDFGVSVADVYAVISGQPVAIEIQRSNLGVYEVTERTKNYHRMGVAVVWVALASESVYEDQYSPRAWEKWVHSACFGRVYYWTEGQTLQPVHFGSFMLHVEQKTFREQGGYERSVGGFDRYSKRWRRPIHGKKVKLSQDFQVTDRRAWSGGTTDVPSCTLFLDHQRKWWS